MSRLKQIFIAPGEENKPLPIEKSAWHIGREAILPKEHWEVIIEFALIKMPEFGELLEEASYLDGDFSNWNKQKTQKLYEGLKQLCILIDKSEPLTPEITDEILEDYTKEAHISMIKTVMAVIEESQRTNQMFDAYGDS